MPRSRLLALASCAAILAACGPSEHAQPVTPPKAAAPTAPTAKPSASAVATAAPAPTASAKPVGRSKPVLRFWSFDGPAEGPAITGKRAWTAVPSGAADDPYRHVFISVEDFVKADASNNFFSAPHGEIVAPIAMGANLAPPAALKKGDPIAAENDNDSALARVVSADADTVHAKYVFGSIAGELDVPRSEVLLLDGTLRLGAPVVFEQAGKKYVGRLLAKTAKDAWVALEYTNNQPYVKVEAAAVRALDVTKVLKAGDACAADSSLVTRNELVPGKVVKVIEDGLFYEVKLDKGGSWTVPFHHVSP